jgi:hypothetical protein
MEHNIGANVDGFAAAVSLLALDDRVELKRAACRRDSGGLLVVFAVFWRRDASSG